MNISVASRFACLKLDDEEPGTQKKIAADKKKPDRGAPVDKKVQKKTQNNPKQLQGGGEGRKDKKVKQQMQKQWEEWKEKDNKLVNGNFEQDLESAILLSKLHYEENKDKYDSKITDNNKKPNKKKKKNVMSLNEFLAVKKTEEEEEVTVKPTELKENFFDEVHTDAKKELTKEQLTQQRKQREAAIEDIISSAQYQEKLDVERKKNEKLEVELETAKKEITTVKSRNQTLYTMLSTGEMKDKADVLLELERLTTIKNDLTDEVARLHGLLEQERSKVASLMNDNKHKDKKFKKHA